MKPMRTPELLPYPRSLRLRPGTYRFPERPVLFLPASLPRDAVLRPVAARLQSALAAWGSMLELVTGPAQHPRLAVAAHQGDPAPAQPEGYRLVIRPQGVTLFYRDEAGLRGAVATLRQLIRQFGSELPALEITDYPDFPRRGLMLDISRGRVPALRTLLDLVEILADWKINEFQLYTEHTFAYRDYAPVWRDWGAITGEDIIRLDARCRDLGIDLVPNQNSFGHLRYWLEYPPLKKLAEVSEPYEGTGGTFLRYPSTLAPNHLGTMPFICSLYDELLPHFTSRFFNVGCDETWDLGRGLSAALCRAKGKGEVYVDFLKRIHREVSSRGKRMMFWGDIILNHPKLLRRLPKDIIALNWGYEASHPFAKETALFAKSGLPFYVCPGTSTWMSLVGRHDNAFANLKQAAAAGLKNGAAGYLNTDWGDGGHPQPLAVSLAPYLVGASVSWCAKTFRENLLVPVLSRDAFQDPSERAARAAIDMGFAHRQFNYFLPNVTPFGTVIAAPLPASRELMNRDGLKLYARIREKNIRAALETLEQHRAILGKAQPETMAGDILVVELDLAARMAEQSCHIMLWQQALAAGKTAQAARMAMKAIPELEAIDRSYREYWPQRNKGTIAKSAHWIQWRIQDYRDGMLHFPPTVARVAKPKTYAAE